MYLKVRNSTEKGAVVAWAGRCGTTAMPGRWDI